MRVAAYRFAGVSLSDGAVVNGSCDLYGPRIVIGRSWIGIGACLISTNDAGIVIGDNCDIGPYLMASVGSHEIGDANRRAGPGTSRTVEIGDGCWIGSRVTILAGVKIGSGCVIGAGSVVTADQAPNTLAAGVPARFVRELSS